MKLNVHVHHHFEGGPLDRLVCLFDIIARNTEKIMQTQAELAADLKKLGDQLTKASGEITTKLDELNAAIITAGNVTPEVQAAMDALKTSAQQLDDIVPDAPTP